MRQEKNCFVARTEAWTGYHPHRMLFFSILAGIWTTSTQAQQVVPSPQDFAWSKDPVTNAWVPVWITIPEVSRACSECSCKGDCTKCKCGKDNLACSPHCNCKCNQNELWTNKQSNTRASLISSIYTVQALEVQKTGKISRHFAIMWEQNFFEVS